MFRKIVTHVALFFLLASFPLGCYSSKMISPEEQGEYVHYGIRRVITFEGETIEFARDGYGELTPDGSAVVGQRLGERQATGEYDRTPISVPWSDVEMVYIEKASPLRTLLLVAAVAGGLVLIFAAAYEGASSPGCYPSGTDISYYSDGGSSCPTLYAFDGRQYVFDGSPYSGSFCEALQTTDLVRLGHLVAVEGEYRLQVGNEVDEIQHIDELKLDVVRHPPDVEVVPDAGGELHTISTRYRPVSAHDAAGEDLHRWLEDRDFLFWEGYPAAIDVVRNPDARDTLFLSFRKPEAAKQVKVLVDGGQSPWAPALMGAYLALWGEEADGLCRELRSDEARSRFLNMLAREEINDLAVRVRTENGWEERGRVPLGVPHGFEERLAVLDIEDVQGSVLEIALTPPAGLWRVGSVNVDYSPDIPVEVIEVPASSAVSDDGRDLRQSLSASDGVFCTLREERSFASLVFPVPSREPGLETTVFARVSGHYDVLGDTVGPRQADVLARFEEEPGFGARFALDVHGKWWDEAMAHVSR